MEFLRLRPRGLVTSRPHLAAQAGTRSGESDEGGGRVAWSERLGRSRGSGPLRWFRWLGNGTRQNAQAGMPRAWCEFSSHGRGRDQAVSPSVTMYFVSQMRLMSNWSLTLRRRTKLFNCQSRILSSCNERLRVQLASRRVGREDNGMEVSTLPIMREAVVQLRSRGK